MINLNKVKLWKAGLVMLLVLFLGFGITENVYAVDEQVSLDIDQATELTSAEGKLKNLSWSLSEGVLTITGAGEMESLWRDDSDWDEYKDEIKKVIIGDEVTNIGGYAFMHHTYLEEVIIGKKVEHIGDGAFMNCTSLTSISLPSATKSVGEESFYGCVKLSDFTWDGLEEIGVAAFGVTGFVEVVIPDNVTSMYPYAFMDCDELISITIGKGVKVIFSNTFIMCDKLETIILGENVISIGESFERSPKLKTVKVYGKDAKYPIGSTSVFSDCPEVTLYGFPGSTTETYATKFELPFQPIVLPDTPIHKKISNTVTGISLYWEMVSGAKSYTLYRALTEDGEYEILAEEVTNTNFMDKAVENGKTYFYKITATDGTEVSEMSEVKGITYVGTPDITSRVNKAAGIELGWNKIPGATGYAVYRKSYTGTDGWVRVATINGNDTFTWKDESVKTKNGEIYRYTVRALAGSDRKTLSGCRTTGRTMARLTSRTISSAVKISAGTVKCTWDTSSKVTGYEVRFMVGSEVIKIYTIGNYKTGVKTFTGLKTGQTYKIQVRSYKKVDGVGTFYSAWSVAKNVGL